MRTTSYMLAAVLLCCAGNAAMADGNVNFILGSRSMDDEGLWKPFEDQSAFSVVGDFSGEGWPVQLAFGLNLSVKSESSVDLALADISFGVTYVALKDTRFRPYVGAGVASMAVVIGRDGTFEADDTDQSFGYYANLGFYARLGGSFNLGIDYRLLRGTELGFHGLDNANYDQVGLLIGFGWPGY